MAGSVSGKRLAGAIACVVVGRRRYGRPCTRRRGVDRRRARGGDRRRVRLRPAPSRSRRAARRCNSSTISSCSRPCDHTMEGMPRIEDYALIGDLQTAALVGRERGRSTGAASRGSTRRLLRGAARRRPTTAAGCSRPAEIRRATERRYRHDTLILETVLRDRRGQRARDRLHAAARASARHRADRRGPRRRRADALGARDPLRLRRRSSRGCGASTTPRVAIAGPDALCFRTPVEVHGEDLTTVSEFTVAAGRAGAVRAHLVPVARARCPRRSTPSRRSPRPRSTGSTGPPSAATRGDYHEEIHQSLLRAEGAHVRADRRASSRRRRRRCRSGSAACATGTTATAGCATRR